MFGFNIRRKEERDAVNLYTQHLMDISDREIEKFQRKMNEIAKAEKWQREVGQPLVEAFYRELEQ